MNKVTRVVQTASFKKAAKKLHQNQKADLDNAVRDLMRDPLLGEQKKGDLSFMRVHKFKMVKQLTLQGYSYEERTVILSFSLSALMKTSTAMPKSCFEL